MAVSFPIMTSGNFVTLHSKCLLLRLKTHLHTQTHKSQPKHTDFSCQVERHRQQRRQQQAPSFVAAALTGRGLVLLSRGKLMRANRCHRLQGQWAAPSARCDRADGRQDPVIFCQSPASVQWPLVTIRVLSSACASMSKCTCLLLTLNPHRELAGSSQHLMSIHVYLITPRPRSLPLSGVEHCPAA